MVLFTTSVPQQNQSASAGIRSYPNLSDTFQYAIIKEQFSRATLNPSGAVAFYSTGGVGTPSVVIASNHLLDMNTSTSINDTAACVVNQIGISRVAYYIDSKTNMEFNMIFKIAPATPVANLQEFYGLHSSGSILSALPTTAVHMGIYVDTSVSNNWKLSSANGTSQVTTDTGIAIATNVFYRLQIIWSGNDAATINFYHDTGDGTSLNTLDKTQSVTSLLTTNSIDTSLFISFFLKTLAITQPEIFIFEWSVAAT